MIIVSFSHLLLLPFDRQGNPTVVSSLSTQFQVQSTLPPNFPAIRFKAPVATTGDVNCAVAVGGNSSTGGSLSPGQSLVLVLRFDACKVNYLVNVTVTFDLEPFMSVSFSLQWKNTSSPPSSQLPVTTYVLIGYQILVWSFRL